MPSIYVLDYTLSLFRLKFTRKHYGTCQLLTQENLTLTTHGNSVIYQQEKMTL